MENKGTGISFYLNDSYLPTIRLNNNYSSLLFEKDETSKYITNQYRRYKWLLNSIEQRRQTILKIVKVIINRQESFFQRRIYRIKTANIKRSCGRNRNA